MNSRLRSPPAIVKTEDASAALLWLPLSMDERTRPWLVLVDVVPAVLRDVLERHVRRPDVVIVHGGVLDDGPYDLKITNPPRSRSESSAWLEFRVPARVRGSSRTLDEVLVVEVDDVAGIRRMIDSLCPPRAVRRRLRSGNPSRHCRRAGRGRTPHRPRACPPPRGCLRLPARGGGPRRARGRHRSFQGSRRRARRSLAARHAVPRGHGPRPGCGRTPPRRRRGA